MDVTLGFSTGVLYKSGLGLREILKLFRDIGLPAVELNFVSAKDLFALEVEALTAADLAGFHYISLHAPCREIWYGYDDHNEREIFSNICWINGLRPLDWVVFHPDRVKDFSLFNDLPFNVAFENMDRRKNWGKTVGYMQELLAQNEKWGFVLDVNHAFTNDPTRVLAAEFYHNCGRRLRQIHLSGYAGYHEALHQTKQEEIIRSIPDFSLPIIVESVLTPETLQAERRFILETIDRLRAA